jgi:hypothetical protein
MTIQTAKPSLKTDVKIALQHRFAGDRTILRLDNDAMINILTTVVTTSGALK